jgi:hypothetical protein
MAELRMARHRGLWFFSRTLKKNVNAPSHFRAARATSMTWLFFAP